ncbi:unnamed protein product, partial [Nesidiocoris tenuis]
MLMFVCLFYRRIRLKKPNWRNLVSKLRMLTIRTTLKRKKKNPRAKRMRVPPTNLK